MSSKKTANTTPDSSDKPLGGRIILDCSALLPGPFVGKLMALRGARVLKIENPDRPDPARVLGGGTHYKDLNEMKELVSLDIVRERGKFHELVRKADGLIEGFRPESKRKLGLDAATLHAVNPKLCIASMVGYSEDGPRRDRGGHNVNFEALTGCLSLFNEMPALPLADLFGAYETALSLTAALDSVARGGPGRRVIVSLARALQQPQSALFREFKETGRVPHPGTTLFSGLYPSHRIYRHPSGRRFAVGAIEPKFWQKFCDILGLPELAGSGLLTGESGTRVVARIEETLAKRPWEEWRKLFQSEDCCVEPVLEYSEVDWDGL